MEVEEMITMFCRSLSKFRTRSVFIYLFGAMLISALATPARAADPWTPSEMMQPKDLAHQIAASKGKLVILQVGFLRLYQQAHIPGAQYCGPAFKPDGMARLKECASKIAKDREVIIYCGCCPWKDCPNIRPAFEALKKMGFTHLKVLDIPQDFGHDWVNKGFPVKASH